MWANKRIYIDAPGAKDKTYTELVLGLIGHLVGTAVIFVTLFSLGWLVSFVLFKLNSVRPLPDDLNRVVAKLEVGIFYADTVLCAVVFAAGAVRFIFDISKVQK